MLLGKWYDSLEERLMKILRDRWGHFTYDWEELMESLRRDDAARAGKGGTWVFGVVERTCKNLYAKQVV